MTHSFNRTILREYDVRGVVGQTLFVEDAYALGRSYAALAVSEGAKKVAVGRDGRTHSPEMEAALVRGLTEGGIDVIRIGMGPSPLLYFAVSTLDVDGGVQVTGSHNPADYNGFKMLLNGRSVFGAEIQDLGRRAAEGDWSEGQGKVEEADIVEAYVDALVKGFDGKPYRIGWDAGNGAGGPILDELVKRLPGEHHTLYTEVDGNFPNHHPDPTVEANLADLKKLVADKNLDFGIAFDGDADRIGAVDAKGRVIWGDQLLIILAADVLKDQPGATIIADVKASQTLFDRIAEMGGKPLMWKTGHSLLKKKLAETGAPLAGEMSGHMFFSEGYFGYDDALFAAGRLLRYVASTGKTLEQLVASLPQYFSTPEMRLACPEERKFQVPDLLKSEFAAKHRVIDIDGIRVEFGDGWGLVRASNTQPVLVVRFEARTEKRLAEIRDTMMGALKRVGVEDAPVAH